MDVVLANEVQRSDRFNFPLALIVFDIDHLSDINSSYGYGVGDRVLERLGILIHKYFRQNDWVFRHAEDSIGVLLCQATPDDAVLLAEHVMGMVKERLGFRDYRTERRVQVTVSAAVVTAQGTSGEPLDTDRLLFEAEAALEQAKRSGHSQVARAVVVPSSLSVAVAAHYLACSAYRRARADRQRDAQDVGAAGGPGNRMGVVRGLPAGHGPAPAPPAVLLTPLLEDRHRRHGSRRPLSASIRARTSGRARRARPSRSARRPGSVRAPSTPRPFFEQHGQVVVGSRIVRVHRQGSNQRVPRLAAAAAGLHRQRQVDERLHVSGVHCERGPEFARGRVQLLPRLRNATPRLLWAFTYRPSIRMARWNSLTASSISPLSWYKKAEVVVDLGVAAHCAPAGCDSRSGRSRNPRPGGSRRRA